MQWWSISENPRLHGGRDELAAGLHCERFAAGLRRDYDAVRAGLTLEQRSGRVEGTVDKIKMLKRQMCGRANFDLLRTRVPPATDHHPITQSAPDPISGSVDNSHPSARHVVAEQRKRGADGALLLPALQALPARNRRSRPEFTGTQVYSFC